MYVLISNWENDPFWFLIEIGRTINHSWTLPSRLMPSGISNPASDISVRYRRIPLPEWVPLFRYRESDICVLYHSGTGLTGCWEAYTLHVHTACCIKTPCASILLVVKKRQTSCTSILLVVGRHPALPYCWWWKNTLHVHTAAVVERHPALSYYWWWRDTLRVHTTGGGETPCTSILLVAERHPALPYC